MLKEEYILLDLDCDTSEQVLGTLADALARGGAVKESFKKAVIEREQTFPTGLPAKACDIAIPHTTGQHTNEPTIAVGVLKKPVEFKQMGSPEISLHPQLVMMLAINDPGEQLTLLRSIMKLLQDNGGLTAIKEAKHTSAVMRILREYLESEGKEG